MFRTPETLNNSEAYEQGKPAKILDRAKLARSVRPFFELLESRRLLAFDLAVLPSLLDSVDNPSVAPILVGLPQREVDPIDTQFPIGSPVQFDASSLPTLSPMQNDLIKFVPADSASASMTILNLVDSLHPEETRSWDYGPGHASPSDFPPFERPAFSNLQELPLLQVMGSLATAQDSMTYHLPLGPGIAGLKIGLTSQPTADSVSNPTFTEFILSDGNGQKLADLGSMEPQALSTSSSGFVDFTNQTAGLQLALKVSSQNAVRSSQTSSSGIGIPDAVNASVVSNSSSQSTSSAYVLTIQAYERSGSPAQVITPTNTLSDETDFSISPPTTDTLVNSTRTVSPNNSNLQVSDDSIEDSGSTSTAPTNVVILQVNTGPLVGRGSAPLGGILASAATEDDPAPFMERFDGILSSYFDGLDIDKHIERAQGSLADPSVVDAELFQENHDPSVDGFERVGESEGNHQPGVSDSLGQDDDNSAAFLASLPAVSLEAFTDDPISKDTYAEMIAQLVKKPRRSPAEVVSWAVASLLVAFGISLTSRSTLPDLMNQVRKPKDNEQLPRRGHEQESRLD